MVDDARVGRGDLGRDEPKERSELREGKAYDVTILEGRANAIRGSMLVEPFSVLVSTRADERHHLVAPYPTVFSLDSRAQHLPNNVCVKKSLLEQEGSAHQ